MDSLDLSEDLNLITRNVEIKCGICGDDHNTLDCTLVKISHHIIDRPIPSRARQSLPDAFEVEVLVDSTTNIKTLEAIDCGTQFGPFQANKLCSLKPSITFPLKVFNSDDEHLSEYYLDTSKEDDCNWLYFIAPASNIEEQNLICYQDNDNIYYGSIRDINPGDILKVWYAPHYADLMNKKTLFIEQNNEVVTEVVEDLPSIELSNLVKTQQNLMKRDIWNCKFCGKSENLVTEFASHLLHHYRSKLQKQCEICKATFKSAQVLRKHSRVVHSIEEPKHKKSEHQKNNTTSPSVLKNVENKDTIGGPLLNDILDGNASLLPQTEFHFNLSNIENQNILLDNDSFNVDSLLNDNVKGMDHFNFELKDAEEEFICDICLMSFIKLVSLVSHIVQHTGENYCKTCNRVYSRRENLKNHACNSYPKFKCEKCEATFTSKKYAAQHMKVVHTKPFKCKDCSLTFSTNNYLNMHKSYCNRTPYVKIKKAKCPECFKIFANNMYLQKHMRRTHSKSEFYKKTQDQYICDVCSNVITGKCAFNKHRKKHFTAGHQCGICDKIFHRKDVLGHHLLTHGINEKPVTCEICSKTLKSKKLLAFHMETHNDTTYNCEICNAKFKQKTNLIKHCTKKHSKFEPNVPKVAKLYECTICKSKMKLKHSLTRHLKRSHGIVSDDILDNLLPKSFKFKKANQKKNNTEETDLETDISVLDLKQTIENMNFTTDISCNEETNMEFEDMLKKTTENLGFLNESNNKIVDNLLDLPIDDAVLNKNVVEKEVCLSLPDLSDADQEIRLGDNAYILENGNIIEPQANSGSVVMYILDNIS